MQSAFSETGRRMIERTIYNKILQWKQEANGKKALLIEGARRTGKSTVVEQFAEAEYDSHILIDFNKAGVRIRKAFDDLNNLDLFFQTLSLEFNTRLFPRRSLIVFDEIQKFPRAREAAKYLVADGRYDYIETGSLISIRENVESITIPSEERKLKMHPVDFAEFLAYMEEKLLAEYILECWQQRRPLERQMHNKAMHLFLEYLLVGGMPQAVVAFKKNGRDFSAADVEKRDILSLYRDDIGKAAKRYNSKVSAIFENIPAYLSAHEKKVVLRDFDERGTFDRYDEPLFWLGDSMICNLCYKCNDPNVGLALNKNESAVKCYMGDTGLLVSLAFNENELMEQQLYRNIIDGKLSLNNGMLYENAIAQMLAAKGRKLYFYTKYNKAKHRNDVEIDFLISNESKTRFRINPIEVKSSKNYTAVSLHRFIEIYGNRAENPMIVHPKNLSVSDGITRIPPYMFALCA